MFARQGTRSRPQVGTGATQVNDRKLLTDNRQLPTANWLLATVVCLVAYLYGALPVVYLLGRQRKVNLKDVGSGNVGGHNLWATGGAARGVIGWVFDASKGLLPVAVCRRLGYPEELARLAGVCGEAGQCWPIFLWLNGGRGISAFVGAGFMIDRPSWIASLAPMIAGGLWRVTPLLARRHKGAAGPLRATRSKAVPLGCFLGAIVFPLAYVWRRPRPFSVAPTLLTMVILVRRLTAPLPDDVMEGPEIRREALLFRLLFDRNTST